MTISLPPALLQRFEEVRKAESRTRSELVREAVRERYLGNRDLRMKAMQAFVGIRKQPAGAPGAVEMVRSLRRGSRLDRLE